MFYVHYCRIEGHVTDTRIFFDLEELCDWFNRQNKLEPTIIIGIEKDEES